MPQNEPQNRKEAPDVERLRALQQGGGRAYDEAYLTLRRELEAYARNVAGGRADQADFQPESIVADALAQGMRPALDACVDDRHLAGYLKNAVRHELLDRVDKKRPGHFAASPDGRVMEPQDPHAGPLTELVAVDTRANERLALERLLTRLDAAPLSDSDRTLVDLYVIERLPWSEIARRTSRTEGASRVAMNRLRERVLPALFAPLASRFPAEVWAVAEALLVRREAPGDVAKERSIGVDQVRRVLAEQVLPVVFDEFGGASAEMLLRLTGFRH